jgi:hypothetical protein
MSARLATTMLAAALALAVATPVSAAGGRLATASVSGANAAAQARIGNRPVRPPDANGDGVRDRRYLGAAYGYYWYEDDSWTEDATREEAPPPPPPQPAAPPPPPPAVGTTLLALPSGCGTVERNGKFLRQCGGAFYEERFEGDRVVYTVVN